MSRRTNGTCHICGREGELSDEHVPPKKAFNDRTVLLYTMEQSIAAGPGGPAGGRRMQGGYKAPTLCPKCNNDTGAWYGSEYVDWADQGLNVLYRAIGEPRIRHTFSVYPARILKQVVAMMFSVNPVTFRERNPELVKFVLDKHAIGLPEKYKIYCYYAISQTCRMIPVSAIMRLGKGVYTISEISSLPFGYVLAFDSQPPDQRLTDISFFANYGFGQHKELSIEFARLPTCLAMPLDYRTKSQIAEEASAARRAGVDEPSDEDVFNFRAASLNAAGSAQRYGGPSDKQAFVLPRLSDKYFDPKPGKRKTGS